MNSIPEEVLLAVAKAIFTQWNNEGDWQYYENSQPNGIVTGYKKAAEKAIEAFGEAIQ